jgi:hypothetical protein
MKRLATFGAVLGVLIVAGTARAEGPPYGWSISASSTDPFVNTTPFVAGVQTVYLWLVCSTPAPAGPGGMAAAEFALCSSNPSNVILATTTMNGFLNAGSPTQLLLAVGGCPTGPVHAANILMMNAVPGQVCICPSAANNLQGTVDCSPNPQVWEIGWLGLVQGAGEPCARTSARCTKPVSVEESTWGSIKSLYR